MREPWVAPDPHGQVVLMFCESLLHVLVEEGVVPREKVIEAIDLVADLVRERAQNSGASGGKEARRPR